jgi:hypothetical protein
MLSAGGPRRRRASMRVSPFKRSIVCAAPMASTVRCCVLECSLLCTRVPASHTMVFLPGISEALEKALEGQKLESMGLLASGMAHDFNNLGGILTSAELAMTESAGNGPMDEELQRIKAAALSGADRRRTDDPGRKTGPSIWTCRLSLLIGEMTHSSAEGFTRNQ